MREALRALGRDPSGRDALLDVKALDVATGKASLYRLRIGEWRAVFELRDGGPYVVRVFHRSEGYDWLERLGY